MAVDRSMVVSWAIKDAFFDRQKVIKAMSATNRRVLSKAGAMVRTTARQSIKRRKSISIPGNPPHAHVKGGIKLIFFGYDAARKSVVVGPIGFDRADAPPLLEYGGSIRKKIKPRRKKTKAQLQKKRQSVIRPRLPKKREFKSKPVRHTYKPRPFMNPAYEREIPIIRQLWKDSIRKR